MTWLRRRRASARATPPTRSGSGANGGWPRPGNNPPDAGKFRGYLEQAGLDKETGFGSHGEWSEVWAVAILGEGQLPDGANPGRDAYNQYVALAERHPWIHAYYFERVANPAEVAEDMAVAAVPGQQAS